MLLELNIKDIALIRKASVCFGPGLNILTGETGAGKSILIGSALLALGSRASSDVIRTGAEEGYAELVFERPGSSENADSVTAGAPDCSPVDQEDRLLVIGRRVTPQRSIFKLNDETVTASKVRTAAEELIDIYGQHEQQSLADPAKHLKILDEFLEISETAVLEETETCYRLSRQAGKLLESFDMDETARLREADLAAYEIGEIEAAAVQDGEEEELVLRYRRLNNLRNIRESVFRAMDELENTNLSGVAREIADAMKYDDSLKDVHSSLMDADSLAGDALRELRSYADGLEEDGAAFEETEKRLDLIRSLMAKYGRTAAQINDYLDRRRQQLSELENYEENRKRAQAEADKADAALEEACARLTDVRKKAAVRFEKQVSAQMKDLGFANAAIKVELQPTQPGASGADRVRFLTALNPGEPLLPMDEAASGGELSRIMLAIKTVLAGKEGTPTLIFDEIDAGISGRTAQKVAEKLKLIAGERQVICITHLPQIAAMADHHFMIDKKEVGGRSVTTIERLDEEGSVNELARLLGGSSITDAVLENARELKKRRGTGGMR